VKEPYLLLVRLINTGNKHIDVRDFEHPVRIELGGATKIVATEVVKRSNPEMQPRLEIVDTSVLVYPMLLNQREWMAFSILMDGEPAERRVVTRISGGTKPRPFKPPTTLPTHLEGAPVAAAVTIFFGGFLLMSAIGSSLWPSFLDPNVPEQEVSTAARVFFFVSMLATLVLSWVGYRVVNQRVAAVHSRRIKNLEVVS
jgi:hypothetical protein